MPTAADSIRFHAIRSGSVRDNIRDSNRERANLCREKAWILHVGHRGSAERRRSEWPGRNHARVPGEVHSRCRSRQNIVDLGQGRSQRPFADVRGYKSGELILAKVDPRRHRRGQPVSSAPIDACCKSKNEQRRPPPWISGCLRTTTEQVRTVRSQRKQPGESNCSNGRRPSNRKR